jgi:hypothetical protein
MVTVNQWGSNNSPNISYVIDYTLTEDGYYSEEPVSLALAKSYCRIQTGNAEDELVALFIASARMAVERFTGLSLVNKSAEVMFFAPQEGFEIPFGPVTSTPTFVDQDATGSSLEIVGFEFPKTLNPYPVIVTATYTCGYSECPTELKNAILFQTNYLYENRGDNNDTGTLCKAAANLARKYSRTPFFQ